MLMESCGVDGGTMMVYSYMVSSRVLVIVPGVEGEGGVGNARSSSGT